MLKNSVVFPKMCSQGLSCIKIYNEKGNELSLTGDDSCGAYRKHNGRMSYAVFQDETMEVELVRDQPFSGDAEDLLKLLAEHLGYKVEKI